MEDHVPRHAQMGAWVLINDRWYEPVDTAQDVREQITRDGDLGHLKDNDPVVLG